MELRSYGGETKYIIKGIKAKNIIIINKGKVSYLEKFLIEKYEAKKTLSKYIYRDYEFLFLNNNIYNGNENKNSIFTYFKLLNYNVLLMADANFEVEKILQKRINYQKWIY